MQSPLVSVSGVRGVVGESFTADIVQAWASAFAAWIRKSSQYSAPPAVAIGRDPRPSGSWASAVVARSIEARGVRTILLGVVPTPTVQLAVTHHGAAGGLVITASHNPREWNGLKFLGADGVFLAAKEMEKLCKDVILNEAKNLAQQPQRDSSTDRRLQNEMMTTDTDAVARHIENILALPIAVERIHARRFRVVVDPVNGTGALAVPPLLERLGCQVTVINGEANGDFAHPPEPTPANLTELGARVAAEHADLGVAVDPDADRLVLADETGTVLSEEYTVTLSVLSVLGSPPQTPGVCNQQTPGVCVAVNLSTTRMVDDVAQMLGARVVRTPVGERHVVEGMREHGAVIGGEGNGGVIMPASHEGRDSLVGAALVLDLLARRAVTLSALRMELPQYVMRKEKFPKREMWNQEAVVDRLAGIFPDAVISTLDGVRADTAGGWVHLRSSNTEPIIRLIGEARTTDTLHQLLQAARAAISVPA